MDDGRDRFLQVGLRAVGWYDVKAASDSVAIDFTGDPGYTQQEFREETDINTIVRRFGLTGEMPQTVSVPRYGDFTEVGDYKSALDAVIAADAAFMELPAALRERFKNDPQELLMFVEDEANLEEARKLGLLKAVEVPPPAPVAPLVEPPVS